MPPDPGQDQSHTPVPGPSEGLRSCFAIDVPAALLARARSGERAAFEQICRWFERPVFTLALRNGAREAQARPCGSTAHADEF